MASTDYQASATTYATQAGIDPNIFNAQIQAESGFNPRATSPAGAQGIAQFMPATAKSMQIDPWNPLAALKAAAYLDAASLQKYGGDYRKMLAAYNCGSGCVDGAVARYGSNWLSHTPNETQGYVKKIMDGAASSKSKTGVQQEPITPGPVSTGNAILDDLKRWGEYIAIFAIAIVLIAAGFFLLNEKQAMQVAKAVIP